jgi:hypothetical protein
LCKCETNFKESERLGNTNSHSVTVIEVEPQWNLIGIFATDSGYDSESESCG